MKQEGKVQSGLRPLVAHEELKLPTSGAITPGQSFRDGGGSHSQARLPQVGRPSAGQALHEGARMSSQGQSRSKFKSPKQKKAANSKSVKVKKDARKAQSLIMVASRSGEPINELSGDSPAKD